MSDLLSAISVLLVFLTFLLNEIQKEVSLILAERKPSQAQKQDRKSYNGRIFSLLFFKAIPIAAIFIIAFYILLPKTITILLSSKITFWGFDELSTIFVFIELGLFGLSFFAISKILKLIKRARQKQ